MTSKIRNNGGDLPKPKFVSEIDVQGSMAKKALLRGIVEDGPEKTVLPQDAAMIFDLVKYGLIRDNFQPTDRGAAYAVVNAGASFTKYLKTYPPNAKKWSNTLENIKPKLRGELLDIWFYITCEVYLENNYFNEYNYFKAPDTLTMEELQNLNLSCMELGLERQQIPQDLLLSLYMPEEMIGMVHNASREELLSQIKSLRRMVNSKKKN